MATGHKGELSLIAVVADEAEPRVEYVHWVDPKTMFGRRAYLDNEHRVKYIVCTRKDVHPLRHYRDCEIVHPAVGARVRRAKADGRQEVRAEIRRLKLLW